MHKQMTDSSLRELLLCVSQGETSVDEAIASLRVEPFQNLEFATLDLHRELRKGFPEVIFCEGKSDEQVGLIFKNLARRSSKLLGTRASKRQFSAAQNLVPKLQYNELARCIWLDQYPNSPKSSGVVIVAAGTSDLPVVEEARLTLTLQGHEPSVIIDVGVAGLHRLFPHISTLQQANVVIVVAGMEGALPSVIGGLTDAPVIAVPTSIGYGANLQGLTAMLAMLTSCSSGIAVVNVDNGYGAARVAGAINGRITA